MSKYSNLEKFLKESNESRMILTYKEIEIIINAKLPESAHKYSESWWANDKTHTQAQAWMNAGYSTDYVTDTYEKNKIVFVAN